MKDGLMMAVQLIAALSILVVLHEWGHYAAARMFGIKVEKFYLFFDAWGVKLLKFKKGDTEFGVGWLPLGGYVKIAGMIDESLDTEQMKQPAQPWEFRSKPAWQRLIVMMGGIIVNLILGIVIFILHTWHYGEEKAVISKLPYGIYAENIGKEIGLKNGDIVYGVNDKEVKYFNDLKQPILFLNSGNFYNVKRGDSTFKVQIPDNIIDKLSSKKDKLFDIAIPAVVDSVVKNTPAHKAGILKNDKIIALNDTFVEFFQEFSTRKSNYANKTVKISILRNSDTITKEVALGKDATFGFNVDLNYIKNCSEKISYSFTKSITHGTNKAYETLRDNIIGFKKMISGKINPSKSVQGPIGIATLFGATFDPQHFWFLTAMLSLVLAFMNFLPIPALDGGHVMFLLVEMVIRRPINEKLMNILQIIGMVILLSLFVFIFGNDIYKLFKN